MISKMAIVGETPIQMLDARYRFCVVNACRGFAKFVLLLIVSSLAVLLFSSMAPASAIQGMASEQPAKLPQTKKEILIVGSEQDFRPFATGMTDDEAGGFTVDLWKAVAAEAGLSYSIRVKAFHDILQDFKKGKIDVLINLARSEERNKFADFTVPHVVVDGAVFVRKGESSIRSEDDLAGKSVIVLNADLAHDYAVEKGWGPQLVLTETADEGFRLLASGKHDAILIGKLPGMQAILALELTNIEVLKFKAGFSQKFTFAVHEGNSGLLAKINDGLAITKANGTYDRLYEKWFGLYEIKEVGLRDLLKYLIPVTVFFLLLGGYFFYRRHVERQDSARKFHEIFNHAGDAIYLTDPETGAIVDCNRKAAALDGYAIEELRTMTLMDIHPENERVTLRQRFKAEVSSDHAKVISGLHHVRKDGSLVSIEVNATLLKRDHIILSIVHNVSERIQTLRKLSRAIEQAGEGILITDTDGIIEYANPAFSELSGYRTEEVIGKTPKLLNSGQQQHGFFEKMWHTILSGHDWHGKMINRKKDGDFYPVMVTISPIKDDSGETTHFVSLQQDLSENEALENRFYQAQKMEALGTLVGGIAHEFNNSLAGMTGNLYLAKMDASHLPSVIEKLDIIENLAFKSAELIKSLLSFARKGVVRKISIDFPLFLKEIVKLHRISLPENINLNLEIATAPATMTVNWDETLLQQVVMNLINNARDALKGIDNPSITIKLRKFSADREFFDKHAEITATHFAYLSIRDNGMGIHAVDLPHILEPFYTTKDIGKGTGLGLSMAIGAVQSHQGCMEVESIEGKGSVFRIYLPLLETEEVASVSSQTDIAKGAMNETILLADDKPHILNTGKAVLENLGYRVLVASDGIEAVAIFKANMDTISIVVTDIMMPRLGGIEAVELMMKLRPDMKAIFMTGYDREEERMDKIHLGRAIIIHKPYKVDEFSRILRRELDA